ncbi:hypothetical protein [Streptomyces virginiae]|uniref:hypothetical protein n=1 Tax=Streptomyces virginiae TaxID=1961 RepID=UPI00224F3330|nr:hypothetical protein [Streptomyces virginiae]MCX5174354.1 hypothetical protein [Streptomyces virginiae]
MFVTALGDPGDVHHGGGDLCPPVVEEDRVVGVVADRDVPHVLRQPYAAQRFDGGVLDGDPGAGGGLVAAAATHHRPPAGAHGGVDAVRNGLG